MAFAEHEKSKGADTQKHKINRTKITNNKKTEHTHTDKYKGQTNTNNTNNNTNQKCTTEQTK